MKEVTIKLLNLSNNCYIAVPEQHWNYLKLLKRTSFKDNSVIKYMINTMLTHKKSIKIPMEQWVSFAGHVHTVEKDLSEKELHHHVLLGTRIHHEKVMTGAKSQRVFGKEGGVNVMTKRVLIDMSDVGKVNSIAPSNRTVAEENLHNNRTAVGADCDGTYTFNIVKYFSIINLSTSLYLNTQTGSSAENYKVVTDFTEIVSDTFKDLAACVLNREIPSVDTNVHRVLWGTFDILFRTPFYYATGAGTQLVNWGIGENNELSLKKLLESDTIPEDYKYLASHIEKFKGMPYEEVIKHVDDEYLHSRYGNDYDVRDSLYDSVTELLDEFDANDKIMGIGVHGTDHEYGAQLANGRAIKTLMSYTTVWNEFALKDFLVNIIYTLSNVFTGSGFTDNLGFKLLSDAENNQIRLKTMCTIGILGTTFFYPGYLYCTRLLSDYKKGADKLKEEKDARINSDPYYDKRRKYRGWREGVLDIYEYGLYVFLIYTAMVEFIGITNVVGKKQALDTFTSQSYSTEWYYVSNLALLKYIQYDRKRQYIGSRNPDSHFKQSLPIITDRALTMVIAIASAENADDFIMESLGSNYAIGIAASGTMLLLVVNAFSQFFNFITGRDKTIINGAIETHAKLMKNPKTRQHAKVMRERLMHNKKFRRAIMSHISII